MLLQIWFIWATNQSSTKGFRPNQFGNPNNFRRAPGTVKLLENPLNQNNLGQGQYRCTNKQNSADGTLTKAQRRNMPHENDVYISEEKVIIRHRQANYKLKKHGHDFDLPYYENQSGWKKTPRNAENLHMFKEKIVKTTLEGRRIEGTYRNNQKVIHYFDQKTNRNVLYDQDTKHFISGWKLTEEQVTDLYKNNNVGKY